MVRVDQLVQHHSRIVLLMHVVWATSGRRRVLEKSADEWLDGVLRRRVREAGCMLLACGNADNHVHALVRYPSTVLVATIVQRLKGCSSYEWNLGASSPQLSWQAGYWAESVSPNASAGVIAYIEGQRSRHAEPSAPEPWELELDASTR